jgi:predicted cobalt transporter CbtA
VGTFVLLAGFLAVVLPGVDEVPEAFPASLLWQFRMSSLGTQAVLWTALGTAFGILSVRAGAPARGSSEATAV